MAGELNLAQLQPDPILTNIAIQSATGGPFVADLILPVRKVPMIYGRYAAYGRENVIADSNAKRAFGAAANEIETSKLWYAFNITSERALSARITDEQRQADPTGTVESQKVRTIQNRLRLDLERDVKAMVDGIGNSAAITTKWDAASPTIEADIDAAKEAFVLLWGVEPNTIIIPAKHARIIKRDATVRSQIQYTHADILVNGDLPPVLWNLKVIIPGAIQKAGAALPVTRIWNSNTVTLLYVADGQPDEDTNTWGLQLRAPMGGNYEWAAYRWRDPNPTAKTDHVAAGFMQLEVVVNSALGYNLTSVLGSP